MAPVRQVTCHVPALGSTSVTGCVRGTSLDEVGVRMLGGRRADVELHVVGAADFHLGRLRRVMAGAVTGGMGASVVLVWRPAALAVVPFEGGNELTPS